MITWQKIELHCHTIASDGDMTPEEIVQYSLNRGYKAIAICDHNTTANIQKVIHSASNTNLIIIPAIEWTTFWGHIVVLGGNCDLDWRTITPQNIDNCIEYARYCGDLVTLAHPFRLGTPFCCGCHNIFSLNCWDSINNYELWSHFEPQNAPDSQLAINQWEDKLLQGQKISAVYGYDWHCPDFSPPVFAYTYLGIEGELSLDSIFTALQNNKTFISLGIKLNLTLQNTCTKVIYNIGDSIPMGDYLLDCETVNCDFYSNFHKAKAQNLIMKCNKNLVEDFCLVDGKTQQLIKISHSGYINFELYGELNNAKSILAITSAFYII